MDRDEPGGRLVEHALRLTVGLTPDQPTGGIRGATIDAAGQQRRVAGQERVVVVGPERGATARRRALDVRGGRPAAPAIRIPAVALEPRLRVRQPPVRVADSRQALLERGGVGEIDLPACHRALGEVEVGVGEAGNGHLVGFEDDPLGMRIGPCLEVHLRPGKGDPAVADSDRLDPAEAGVAGQRGDASGDQRVERHETSLRVGADGRLPGHSRSVGSDGPACSRPLGVPARGR